MKESESIEEQNKLYIRFLVVLVGQACNLRCRDCGNFAPFAPKETLRYDVNRIIGHLKIITKYARIRYDWNVALPLLVGNISWKECRRNHYFLIYRDSNYKDFHPNHYPNER